MSESQETHATESTTTPASPESDHTESVTRSFVDNAFDAGTKAVVDVLAFTREALKKSAAALEESAKKVDALQSSLKS